MTRGWTAPAYIPIWLGLLRHRKTHRLALAGGVSTNEAVGWLIRLWTWAAEFAPDGDLGLNDAEIVHLLDPPARRRGLAVAALVDAGFLTEDRRLHDWDDWTGAHLARLGRERDRCATFRASKGTASAREPGGVRPRSERGATNVEERREDERREESSSGAPGTAARAEGSTGPGRQIWDVFDAALGPAVTSGERGRRGAAVRDLMQAGISSDAVRRACLAWPRVFPDAVMTETGVAAHVTRLEAGVRARGGRSVASIVAAVTEAVGA